MTEKRPSDMTYDERMALPWEDNREAPVVPYWRPTDVALEKTPSGAVVSYGQLADGSWVKKAVF